MFENDLKLRCEKIFGVPKTTYDAPDLEAPEQDTLFIEILSVRARMSNKEGGRQSAKVEAALTVFSQSERLPFGFFAKRIEQAEASLKAPFIFDRETDITDSPARIQNIHERRLGFTFLYDSQYDPNKGSMTSLNLHLEMEA